MGTSQSDFAALAESSLQDMAARGGVKRYPAHAVIITEGDANNSLYIILSGRVKVYASNEAGKEVILNTHGAGEYVGELAIDGGLRSASVMTLEPTTCVVVTGASLRDFVVEHPDFALHLIDGLIARVRQLTENVKSLALEDVYGRVASLLKALAVEEGTRRVVTERLTQQDIAERVGSSREMVNRIFKELTSGGYLVVEAGRIE
ncbi:MAG: Crp/Fnr family transcriptional regulator, partial [Burkholderiales bacterium]